MEWLHQVRLPPNNGMHPIADTRDFIISTGSGRRVKYLALGCSLCRMINRGKTKKTFSFDPSLGFCTLNPEY
jgi:hypothetical protein